MAAKEKTASSVKVGTREETASNNHANDNSFFTFFQVKLSIIDFLADATVWVYLPYLTILFFEG
ncbi:MAG: hypothetical protein ACD_50C00104G0001, partial [uncultured bacterium]